MSTELITPPVAVESYRVIRRNGQATAWDPHKIELALTKVCIAVHGAAVAQSQQFHEKIALLTERVGQAITRHKTGDTPIHVEEIQDQVELALMRAEEHQLARAYVLYREQQASLRKTKAPASPDAELPARQVRDQQGQSVPLDHALWRGKLVNACAALPEVDVTTLYRQAVDNLFDGAGFDDIYRALILTVRGRIETDPQYNRVAVALLLDQTALQVQQANGVVPRFGEPFDYRALFVQSIQHGVAVGLLDPRLAEFDLPRLAAALEPDRDHQLQYLGLQTLVDRYFLRHEEQPVELPQIFFMRVAMGLAVQEIDREHHAIAFYNLLSSFRFMCSSPTLFNSGTRHAQLSSCFLTTISDDLGDIYSAVRDNALLSKFAGGIGNDWTRIRAMGSPIKGTNGRSLGIVPFLKVANDTAVAVNQGGKRKGAVCAYLEIWHRDIEEFLELRKNTGDDRRRTHDMNTAVWVPDLFIKRIESEGDWTLFSPDEVADLHECYGAEFEKRYLAYEQAAAAGKLRQAQTMPALSLWRKLLTMLFETGHPWITFKDPCNLRSPQQHAGVVHSSNLCTEITLNTSDDEIAVCNLGSVNLPAHLNDEGLDHERLRATIHTAMRLLDNVIDINYYTVPQARRSNLRHRPVGLGQMGFQDALYRLGLAYDSQEAVTFADRSSEAVSYYALEASAKLAAERGVYPSYRGSLWDQGILPIDSLNLLEAARGGWLEVDRETTMDWQALRARIAADGMRNSNCLAIAPTATIANICGISQSIEPTYRHLFVKSNMSGDFTVINPYLIEALTAEGLWDEATLADLKYFDGCLAPIKRIPEALKRRFRTAFEMEPEWLIEAAARRQKWLDQAQSLNLYLDQPSGRKLDQMYRLAWLRGLKTTYYLRSMGASHAEKVTVQQGELNAVRAQPAASCSIEDGDCDACQ
ncbi:ribonucleoside-diphosphate reductase subunit alpha [Acanthopleuribacter pedis]|uniref:Ribonucleoside-diphosphate reductase n=1 Tax=Acanthopleuribacter pedis TaxID=442870 RepID=A0A8J7U3T6_9BACT|nr:ribonucleoside-diphosphate reductase subunit alpha [Acanthopleuribacter pedis]MBO1320778.1 ribonucleoside-diphosphate reductase subunit alpha [Acanthopleuribacter pedis]